MFVLTADQIDSRSGPDLVPGALALLEDLAPMLATRSDRTAGDEIQLVTSDAATALEAVLRLARDGRWRTGLGIDEVELPLPAQAREGRGAAFVRARSAITAARRSPVAFALDGPEGPGPLGPEDVGALVDLLLAVLARRSAEGWEVCDVLRDGGTQHAAAVRLGISPQAVSLRLRAAGWRLERRARPALVHALEALDHVDSAGVGAPP